MLKGETKYLIVELAFGAAGLAGVGMMSLNSFEGTLAALGLLLACLGFAGCWMTDWLRRQFNIRFRRRFRK